MDLKYRLEELKSQMRIVPESLALSIESFIREHVEKLKREGVILGLSGGIDSVVACALCIQALGADKISALIMPDKDSEEKHKNDAIDFAKQFNIKTRLIDISPYLRKLGVYRLFSLKKLPLGKRITGTIIKKALNYYEIKTGESIFSASMLGLKDKSFSHYLKKSNAYYRVKHRLRMILLYFYGELENSLVVGATNKTEYKIGFFVKHGCDNAADIMPLLGLYKTQVRELAGYLGISPKIIEKPPSPDIIPGIIDEEAIGIPYEQLDLILMALEEGWKVSEIADTLEIEIAMVKYIKDLVNMSNHMREIYIPR